MGTNVLLSGAVLSSMIFENYNKDGIGEGFLIGEIEKITTHDITDSQMCLENTHFMASISGYLPCASLQSFYNGCGQLKIPNLMEIVGDNFSKVIGWYRCRGTCNITFLRETHIHTQLSKLMNYAKEHFIFVLFSTTADGTGGTLGTMYKFFTMPDRELVPASYKIANMSETSSATYYKEWPNTHLYASHALEKSLKCIDNLEPGVKEIQELYNRILYQLKELLPKYSLVCKTQSESVEELMKLKAACCAAGLTPNYVPTQSEEKKIDEQILNKGGKKDNKKPLKEKSQSATKGPQLEHKSAIDKNKKDSPIIKSKSRLIPNGDVNDSIQKIRPKFKNVVHTKSMSPSSSSRLAREPIRKRLPECVAVNKNDRIKSAHTVGLSHKSPLLKRPESNSPSKISKQLSASPEF